MTPKQELFCIEYLKDKNATQAYIRAGYKGKGHVAESAAARLLSNVEIKQYIAERLTEVKEDLVIEVKEVLREMLRIGRSDIRKIFKEDGSMKLPNEWDDDIAASISGIEVNEIGVEGVVIGHTKKVKMWDKTKGLEMLGRHLKLFTDVLEVKDVTPLADRMKQARERAKTK